MAKTQAMSVTVGITGASGAVYAQALLRMLDRDVRVDHVYLVASDAGLRLVASELGLVASEAKKLGGMMVGAGTGASVGGAAGAGAKIETLPNKDIGASIASGSAPVDAMVVIPCSAGAMGAIAAGTATDLLTRSADVCLKERRPLVLCLRETPLNRIHLENMLRAHDAGAVVMPAMPAFYYEPKTIQDLVEQYACRVLAQIGLPQEKQYVWKGGALGADKQ
jgi:flavin prenyltransferase